jgi:hypothetical protein
MTPFSIFDFGFSIGRSERKKIFCLVLCALLFALGVQAQAQQPGKIYRLGRLSGSLASSSTFNHDAL